MPGLTGGERRVVELSETLTKTEPPAPGEALDPATASDPLAVFRAWLAEAGGTEVNDPNAMQLATVDETGLPNLRTVLLKGFDVRGFVFYTNHGSAKGRELLASRKAALLFHWKSLRRQVRVRGAVEEVSAEESDAYYASRPRGSRIGAWASEQSRPLDSRATLEARVKALEAEYEGRDIPRPSHWGGFRVVPREVELWADGPFRLHDRFLFTRADDGWDRKRLNP